MSNNNNNEMSNTTQLQRKRSSVQSNLSSMNGGGGGGGSLHSSSSTVTSDEGNGDGQAAAVYSNADYEHIRNSTLLFFLDRLYLASQEGKEARTLHDLSCLFGTKDFTKEMRQIVGASKNGLKRFLQSYPSLFQIDGDKVHLTQLNKDSSSSTQRDYNREAVDYFKLKLNQFGTSLVPIKNLFGYRSQATQEVRHVSGKNTRDFKRFLRQNSSTFEILADEHVVLKSALAELESSGATSLALLEQSLTPLAGEEAIVMDPYLNKQFAHLVEQCIKNMAAEEKQDQGDNDQFKVTIEQLFERIKCDCENEKLFLKIVKSCEDLKVFLRMHPKLFKRFTVQQEIKCDQQQEEETKAIDYVSLLSEAEQRELEAAAVQQHNLMISQRQHSTLNRSMSATTTTTSSPTASGQPQNKTPTQTSQLEQQKSRPQVVSQKSQEPRSLPPNTNTNNNNNKLTSHQLRANAPPFVPNNLNNKPQNQRQNNSPRNNNNDVVMQRSHSNLSRGPPANNNKPVDQRGAIRNYLLKGATTNNNTTNTTGNLNSHNLSWSKAAPVSLPPQSKRADGQPPTQAQASSIVKPTTTTTTTTGEDMRARTVDMVREASNIITRIMTSTDAVAFDCKGYNLGFDGQITLIQFGYVPKENNKQFVDTIRREKQSTTSDESNSKAYVKPEVCVFDLITNPELAYCLKPLLESDKIVKIVHDVRNKSNALHVQFDIILNNVFDTQVANLVVQQQDTGKPAYKSRYISMSKLCEIYGNEELLRYRNLIKYKTRHSNSTTTTGNSRSSIHARDNNNATSSSSSSSKDVNYWRTRPLTKPMIFEATMDVYCLVGGIYQNLSSKIKPEYEPLFDQLNLEGVLARIKPEEIRSAKKERKIDLEVIDLKRKLYSDSTGPVVLSNREIRLLRHIDLTDEVRAKIQQCKKVAKKLERLDMKAAQMKSQLEGGEGDQSTASESMSSINNNNNNLDCESSIDCQSLMLSMNNNNGVVDQKKSVNEGEDSQNDEIMLMANLMDSSMFDELKDKMIESSSLLESLEDDDDDVVEEKLQVKSNHHHQHLHKHHQDHHGDCQQCKCQCHGNSNSSSSNSIAENCSKELKPEPEKATTTTTSEPEQQQQQQQQQPKTGEKEVAKETSEVVVEEQETSASQEEVDLNQPEQELQQEQQQAGDESDKSSLACDMAVQCDLLS